MPFIHNLDIHPQDPSAVVLPTASPGSDYINTADPETTCHPQFLNTLFYTLFLWQDGADALRSPFKGT